MTRSPTLTLVMPPDLRAIVQEYATRYGLTIGAAARILIRKGAEAETR